MSHRLSVTLAVLVLALVPSLAQAQATLAGVVRDSSGAPVPGVTVEAASPALIEKVRIAITDNSGQYRIVDLRPGVYTVTFTLQGFAPVRREQVELSGVAVRTIDASLRVGAITDTVVVTGETPTVDTQSVRRESVIDNEIINSLPVSRGYGDVMLAIPTLQGGPLNASVNALSVLPNFFTVHGGRGNEGNIQVDGMNVGAAFNGGGVSGYAYDISNSQEMQITLSGALGESETGGPTLNLVSSSGGNRFAGTIFGSGAGEWSQGTNIDDELRSQGITEQAALIKSWDISGTLGGPILRDRVWFFFNYRDYGNHTDIPGLYANANAGNAASWEYVQDLGTKARAATSKTVAAGRLTAQVTPRNKVGVYFDYQWDCDQGAQDQDPSSCRPRGDDWVLGSSFFGPAWSAEAISNYWDAREKITQVTWQSPATTKLLLDAGYSSFVSHWGWMKQPGAPLDLEAVLNVAPCPAPASPGEPAPFCPAVRFYRGLGWADMLDNEQQNDQWRASLSYVTGTHNLKVGYQGAYYMQEDEQQTNNPQLRYLMVGAGPNPFPLSFDMMIRPWQISNRTQMHAFYVQDQWTAGRVTLQGALRYDTARSWFPSEHNGAPFATRFNPEPITFPRTEGVLGYHDVTPRGGLAWDMFGSGRTSLKVNLGKYLRRATNDTTYTINNPATTFQTVATRAWFDADGDYAPDCNFLDPNANGECTAADLGNFANPNAITAVNPDVLKGWGVRPYDWQLGVSVQQQIAPRTSLEVGYHRRWFGNFFVTDNINLGPQDFTLATVTAPASEDLPDGGGFQETFFVPTIAAPIQNTYTFASDYGGWEQYWHGVDVTIVARLRNGLVLQGGTSTGRGVLDNCEVVNQLPEMLNPALTAPGQNPLTTATQPATSCRVYEKIQTQLRGNVTYTIPGIDVLLSGIFRSQPNATIAGGDNLGSNGQGLAANYSTDVNGVTRNVNLLQPGQHFGDRINQLDLRVGKILRFGGVRTNIALDFLNVFNANTATAFNQAFNDNTIDSYLTPTQILNPRFVRFNVTIDY